MFTSIDRFTFPTFALYIALAALISGAIAVWRLHRQGAKLGAAVDVMLGALLLGFLLARAEYALLNPDAFSGNWRGVFTMQPGGLDWHGALFGGAVGAWLMACVRGVPFADVLAALAPAVPLVAFAGWTACRAIGCAYGAEVPTLALYPAWQVAETPNIFGIIAPRYDTHRFGQAAAWLLLLTLALLWMRPRRVGAWGFWLMVCGLAAAMFVIGGYRADIAPVWAGLRADRWLDGVVFAWGVVGAALYIRRAAVIGAPA